MAYDPKATKRLADLMLETIRPNPQSTVDPEYIGKSWSNKIEKQQAQRIISDIKTALEDRADPNPIPNKSLLAVLCSCPFDKLNELSECIALSIKRGVDVTTPLVYEYGLPRYDEQEKLKTLVVRSPITFMFDRVNYDEAAVRMNAIFSKIKDSDVQSLFCPRLLLSKDEPEQVHIVEPLLCSHLEYANCEALLSHLEKVQDPDVKNSIVNAKVELRNGEWAYNPDATYAWYVKNGLKNPFHDSTRSWIGNTAIHEYMEYAIEDDYPNLPVLLKRFQALGADMTIQNVAGLTPYGIACSKGIESVLSSDVFKPDRSEEFSHRDCLDRLLPTRVLNSISLLDMNYHSFDKAQMLLNEYKNCKKIDVDDKVEINDVLSSTLAKTASLDLYNTYLCSLIFSLLNAGADVRYALPGELPTWQKFVMIHGDTPITRDVVSSLSDRTVEETEWAKQLGVEVPMEQYLER